MNRLIVMADPPATFKAIKPVSTVNAMLVNNVTAYNSCTLSSVRTDTNKWLNTTKVMCAYRRRSKASKKMTLQNVCNKIMHNACTELVMKNMSEPLFSPIVAGPTYIK